MLKVILKARKYLPGFAIVTVYKGKKELIAFVCPLQVLEDNEQLLSIISQLFQNRKVVKYGI